MFSLPHLVPQERQQSLQYAWNAKENIIRFSKYICELCLIESSHSSANFQSVPNLINSVKQTNVIFSLYYLKPAVISSLSLVHLVLNQGWPSESHTELEAKTNMGLISKDSDTIGLG